MLQKVAIIGAGPSGLAAAKALKQYPNLSAVIFEAKSTLGGLWAISEHPSSDTIKCSSWLRTNLSQFTCSFSDLPWRPTSNRRRSYLFPKAPQVQTYLQDYASSLSKNIFRLNTRVTRVEHKSQPEQSLWTVSFLQESGEETSEDFDFVIVASGFFSRPWIPPALIKVSMPAPCVLHSSEYAFDRILSLFPSASDVNHMPKKRKIVVIGGSLSAVEVVSDLCININSIRPDDMTLSMSNDRSNVWEVIHVSPRPFWVLPRFLPHFETALGNTSLTSPPKFLPLDLIFYDVSKLRNPASESKAPPSEAVRFYLSNTNLGTLLGYRSHAQADLSSSLEITEENGWMSNPPWLAISDTYANFLREKNAEIVIGHVAGVDIANDSKITLNLTQNSNVETITGVDAIITCTGYEPSLDKFLSPEILHAMEYSTTSPSNSDITFLPAILPQQMFLPHSPDLPHLVTTTIGFVGMYKGPYFGVIELQARYLAALFAGELPWPEQETLSMDAEAMRSMRRSREMGQVGDDGSRKRKQWSCDYMGIMKGLAEKLGVVEGTPFFGQDSSSNSGIDPIIPAHFSSQDASQDALKSLQALEEALYTSFLPISVFRALHGSWKVHRRIVSYLPDVSGGVFEGTANFLPRRSEDANYPIIEAFEYEYLYSERGSFILSNNPEMKLDARKKYIFRYEEERDVISVWFVKGDGWTADNLFHEVTDFDGTGSAAASTTSRSAVDACGTRHLCGQDTYKTSYHFSFLNSGPELESFCIRYRVEGPRKNYTSEATYERASL